MIGALLRMMVAAMICVAGMPLAGCASLPHVDLCKRAPLRRRIYVTAIAAADAYAATGRPVPASVTLGRQATATALAVLNAHCPVPG